MAHYPNSEFVGYDLSKHALQQAREEAEAEDLVNVRFMERDLTEFGVQAEPRQFDWGTAFDAVRDQAAPQGV